MSLIATRMQPWRLANPNLDRNMTRPAEYGALDLFRTETESGTGIISAETRRRVFASMGNTVNIPVINYDGNVAVSNARTCTIADLENTSALVSLTFATYQVGFTMVPALFMNNDISYEHDFARKMEKVSRALADALDKAAVAKLEADKTQVFADLLYYTQAGNAIQAPWAMRQEILGDLTPIMRANDYRTPIHLVGGAGLDSLILKLAQHGVYNDVNKRLEFEGKVLHYSNNVTKETGKFASLFAVAEGNVAMLTRVDREAFAGTKTFNHEWGVVNMPYSGIEVGSHYYREVGDQSAIAGASSADMTCNVKEYFGFSVDVAFLTAYNSDPATIANPIVKVDIAAPAGGNPVAVPVEVTNTEANPVNMKTVGA